MLKAQKKRVLFLGFIADPDTLADAFRSEKSPQVSAIEYQLGILEALTTNGTEPFVLGTLPIASYPHNEILFVKGHHFRIDLGNVHGRLMGYVNLSFVKLLYRFLSALFLGAINLVGQNKCESIIVYSIHAPYLIAGVLLGKIFRKPVGVFINDLPIYMGTTDAKGMHAFIKRFETKVSKWIIGYATVAFPVSIKIAQDWLPKSLRYLTIEAIVPSGSIVPKAYPKPCIENNIGCPRLLYTGTFSYVIQFAQLFKDNRDIDAQLVFIGGGPDETKLRELAAIDPRIEVKSFARGDALEQEIDNCDFLVNARRSDWDGGKYSFGFKLFDYMIRGRPILSTRLGSITDNFFDCFLAIEDDTSSAFKRSMTEALSTPKSELTRRVQNGLRIVQVDKSPSAVGRLMLDALAK